MKDKKLVSHPKILIFCAALIFGLFLVTPPSNPVTAGRGKTVESATASNLPDELIFCGVFPIVNRPDAGPDRRDAFLLAIDQINVQTNSDRILPLNTIVRGVVQDDDNTAAGGAVAAQECITQGAHVVIGSSGSSSSAVMAIKLATAQLPQISYASTSPALSDRQTYPYFMRVVAPPVWEGKAIAELVAQFNWVKGAIIHTDDSYGQSHPEVFKTEWSGTVVTQQTFIPQATDVSTQVAALKSAVDNDGVEFILLNAIDVDARTVLKEALETGLIHESGVAWILTSGSTSTATFSGDIELEQAMENMLGTRPGSYIGDNYQDFSDAWLISSCGNQTPCGFTRTGQEPNNFAPFAYDATFVAAEGFASALLQDPGFDGTNGTALLEALYTVTHEGATGSIWFDELGEVVGQYDIVQVQDGDFIAVGFWQANLILDQNIRSLQFNPGTSMQFSSASDENGIVIDPLLISGLSILAIIPIGLIIGASIASILRRFKLE